MGIKLQTLARIVFPNIVGKEYNHLLKGRFNQGLLLKWQRKLGAPKPNKTFEELYDRALTLERHDRQYSQSTAERNDPKGTKKDKPARKSEGEPKADAMESNTAGPTKTQSTGQSRIICYNCEKPGHIARECWRPKKRPEANGMSSRPKILTTVADMTDRQLE